MEPISLTFEMMVVLGLLGFTIFLFVSEVIRVDLAGLLVMVILGGLSYLPGLGDLADVTHLFDGFASNAVISIIAVMIIGAGLDKTGLMTKVAAMILKFGGSTEKRVVPIISGTVGVISSFLQNVGAAALFLPVVARISSRTEIPLGRLLMPMGFCAILGGTMTMVGSSPLILLNDLLITANKDLPADAQMAPFSLFSVAPVGAALIVSGILYFVLFGRWVLPKTAARADASSAQSIKDYLKRLYGLKADIVEVIIPEGNILIDETLGEIMDAHHMSIIGSYYNGQRWLAPLVTTKIQAPCRLAILGRKKVIEEFADLYNLTILPGLEIFREEYTATKSGVAEIVIPPDSGVIGKSAREVRLRGTYGLNLLAIHRGDETLSRVETKEHTACLLGQEPIHAGDTLVVHAQWENLARASKNRDFVVVTSDYPQEELRPHKVGWALLFFGIALALILLTDVRLSLALLVGAVGMILSRVISIDEAYGAVGWNTVFLLASLIPLGHAVQSSGTAEWIAQQVLILLDGWPIWALQTGVAVLATVFTLIMSNVGATVLLVPLAVSIAVASGGDPAVFAMTVAISTSNSFLIPTHQVNALIMGPAGYRVKDFVKTGGIMTIIFLVVSMLMMNVVFG
ncbi:MAG: SLC13 family permease [Proteobacteria bacterium]|nr:SLC13 family permease [Pseudomonadota bacterium]